jgi:DNA-binding beta-propeller fold protein YncE
MKNLGIAIFLIVVGMVIVVIVAVDFLSSRPGKGKANPYEFSFADYKKVDDSLMIYGEIKQIKIDCETPGGISYHENKIFLLADKYLKVLDPSGKQLLRKDFSEKPMCVAANESAIVVAFKNYFAVLNPSAGVMHKSARENEKAVFTSIAFRNNRIYIADAGNRKVLIYDQKGKKLGEFEGNSGVSVMHGFIIPSPYFDLAVNDKDELWVVNPGMHLIQNYEENGSLSGFWGKTSVETDGFSGCCNPAHFAFLPDGYFVTSEKGLVRIKIYDPAGKLKAVVAPPEKFNEGGKAPDISVNEKGDIFALDYDRKMIRIFQMK